MNMIDQIEVAGTTYDLPVKIWKTPCEPYSTTYEGDVLIPTWLLESREASSGDPVTMEIPEPGYYIVTDEEGNVSPLIDGIVHILETVKNGTPCKKISFALHTMGWSYGVYVYATDDTKSEWTW